MNEDRPSTNGSSHQRSWLDRLSLLLGEPRDREQLVELLRDAQRRNLIDADALTMIEGVLQVAEMQVRDIMIPRSQMVVLERSAPPEAWLPVVIESGHSRFPVIGESRDEVLGIVLAKDLLRYFAETCNGRAFDVREILRPAVFIPESKRLNVLLREFREKRYHMAVVVDEYGGIAGLVTIEDVLEEIVGDIEDETDDAEQDMIRELEDNRFLVAALTPVEDFNEFFNSGLSEEEFDTIGGILLQAFGQFPKVGESIAIDNLTFTVVDGDKRQIRQLEVQVSPADSD